MKTAPPRPSSNTRSDPGERKGILNIERAGANYFSHRRVFATPFASPFAYTILHPQKTEGEKMGIFDQEKNSKDVDDLIYGDDRAISQR